MKSVQDLKGDITFEFPNTNLESFRGSVEYKGEQQNIPLNHKNILLRGCTLRNTAFVVGIMVYAGHDTKIMKNTGAGRMKRTHLDFQLDWLVMTVRCRTCFVRQTAHMLVCAAGPVAPSQKVQPPPPSDVQYWAGLHPADFLPPFHGRRHRFHLQLHLGGRRRRGNIHVLCGTSCRHYITNAPPAH